MRTVWKMVTEENHLSKMSFWHQRGWDLATKKEMRILWRCAIFAILWVIWFERNSRILKERRMEVEVLWDNLVSHFNLVQNCRENLQLLRQRYYYATWKADGTRYMLLLSPDGCYLVDRKFKFRRVQLKFPCKNMAEFHQYTLLDGEMVIDTVNSQKQERRYLIYDLIALNRMSLVERPFHERWRMIEKEVVEPRNHDRRMMDSQSKPLYRYDLEPFRVRRKDFWLLSTVGKVLKEFIPRLSHESDGLIFQGWDDPYVPRTHEGLLKWKYAEMNSVDFLFEIGEDDVELLYLYERGKKRAMDGNRVVFGDGSDPSSFSGKIIECSWDSEENIWKCMRVRTDKSTPNEFMTYKKVMRSIKDNITEDILLNEIGEIIRLPMYSDRIQYDSRVQKNRKPAAPPGKIHG